MSENTARARLPGAETVIWLKEQRIGEVFSSSLTTNNAPRPIGFSSMIMGTATYTQYVAFRIKDSERGIGIMVRENEEGRKIGLCNYDNIISKNTVEMAAEKYREIDEKNIVPGIRRILDNERFQKFLPRGRKKFKY